MAKSAPDSFVQWIEDRYGSEVSQLFKLRYAEFADADQEAAPGFILQQILSKIGEKGKSDVSDHKFTGYLSH